MNKKRKKGFTLIELLAIVAILGLVLLVVGWIIIEIIDNSKKNAKDAIYNSINTSAIAFVTENRVNASDWFEGGGTDIEYACTTVQQLINTGFLKTNIVDPETGKSFPVNTAIKVSRNKTSKVIEKSELNSDDCKLETPVIESFELTGPFRSVKDVSGNDIIWYYDIDGGEQTKLNVSVSNTELDDSLTYGYTIKNNNGDNFGFNSIDDVIILSENISDKSNYGRNLKICARVMNNSGMESTEKCLNGVNLDFTIPSAPTLLANDGKISEEWHKDAFDLSVSSTASSPSGIYYSYKINDSATMIPVGNTNKITGINSENAKYTVQVCNNVGKCSESSYEAMVDTVNPIIDEFYLERDESDGSYDLKAIFKDELSGVVKYKINKSSVYNGSIWTEILSDGSKEVFNYTVENISQNADYYLWVEDEAGNYISKELPVSAIDDTLPLCVYPSDSTFWTNSSRTVEYGCSDDSGCDPNFSGDTTIVNYSAETFTIPSYRIKDTFGNEKNCGSKIVDVLVDIDVPIIDEFYLERDESDGSYDLKAIFKDELSGVVKYKINKSSVYSNIGWVEELDVGSDETFTYIFENVSENADYYLWVEDEAGNYISKELPVEFPSSPILLANDNVESDDWHASSFYLNVSGGGTSTGGIYYEYSVDGGNTVHIVSDNTIYVDSDNTYSVRTCNNIGICSEYSVYIAKILSLRPPTITASAGQNGVWYTSTISKVVITGDSSISNAYLKYSINGTESKTSVGTVTYTKTSISSSTMFEARLCVNINGEVCSDVTTYNALIDTVTLINTPTVTSSDGVASKVWHNDKEKLDDGKSFTLNLSYKTNSTYKMPASGIYYKYTIDDGEEIIVDGSSIKIDSEQIATYKFTACSTVGKCGSSFTYIVKFDITPPELISFVKSTEENTRLLTLTAKFKDNLSGMLRYKIKKDEPSYVKANWAEVYNTNYPKDEVEYSLENIYENESYYLWVEDSAGNYTSYKIIVDNIDNNGPVYVSGGDKVIPITIVSNGVKSFKYKVNEAIFDDLEGSDPVTVYYAIDEYNYGLSASSITSTSNEFTGTCGKTYYVYVKAEDSLGNVTTIGDTTNFSDSLTSFVYNCCEVSAWTNVGGCSDYGWQEQTRTNNCLVGNTKETQYVACQSSTIFSYDDYGECTSDGYRYLCDYVYSGGEKSTYLYGEDLCYDRIRCDDFDTEVDKDKKYTHHVGCNYKNSCSSGYLDYGGGGQCREILPTEVGSSYTCPYGLYSYTCSCCNEGYYLDSQGYCRVE